jgi:hypothetical protein
MPTDGFLSWANLSRMLEWLSIFVSSALVFKMWKTGLRSIYPVLFVFSTFTLFTSLISQFLPRNTNLYAIVWLTFRPFHWTLYFGVVYEIYRRVLEEHRGIASAGRWVVTAGVIVAIAVTGVTMLADLSAMHQKYPILFAMHVTERALTTALALLLLILSGFLLYFPVLLRRNSLLIVTGLTIYFLFKALLLLMRNLMGPQTVVALNIWIQLLNLVITTVWLWRLIPQAADQTSGPRASVPKERAEEMLRRLGQMNEVLLRSGGK